MPNPFKTLYFAVQQSRSGVTRSMIREASLILDASQDHIRHHVRSRLQALHGPAATQEGWLHSQALVERSTLNPRVRALLASRLPPRVDWLKTSGSTGTPFVFLKDREMTAWMDAVMWAVYSWHGVFPGAKGARFWGAPITPLARLRRRATDYFLRHRRFSAFDLAPKRSVDFFRSMRRFRPTYVYGYPTLLRAFVEDCLAAGLDGRDLAVRTVISTGEVLSPESRRLLADFFEARIVNEYGCTESGIISIECEYGTPHALPCAAYAEVVNESGRPVGEREHGEIVVSHLFGTVMPLLRYRLHDTGSPSKFSCPCGRSLLRLEPASGRIDSFIQTPHRGQVYDAILAYTVPKAVQRFRARQLSLDHLAVDIVPGSGYQPDVTPRECRRTWERVLAPDMRVTVRTVDDLPYEASGKLRYFVPMPIENGLDKP